jgi:hypothetical protein
MRIGIALAAFEPHPAWLLAQVESIRAQTFRNWRLFIGFDSSPPPSLKLPQDERIEWEVHPQRLGLKGNFESQTRKALQWKPDALAFSDQDDLWDTQKLEVLAAMLPPMGLVHSNARLFGAQGGLLWETERRGVEQASTLDLLIRNVVAGAGLLMDATLASLFPSLPPEVPFHDHWYALLASAHGGIRPFHQPLYSYRIHDHNTAGLTPYRHLFYTKASWLKAPTRYYNASLALAHRLALTLEATHPNPGFMKAFEHPSRLFWHALKQLRKDPMLARSTWVRMLGGMLPKPS